MKLKVSTTAAQLENSAQLAQQNGLESFECRIRNNLDLSLMTRPNGAKNGRDNSTINRNHRRRFATNLTTYERQLIEEVQHALAATCEDESKLTYAGEVSCVNAAINLPAFYIKRVVRFCSKIAPFKALAGPIR